MTHFGGRSVTALYTAANSRAQNKHALQLLREKREGAFAHFLAAFEGQKSAFTARNRIPVFPSNAKSIGFSPFLEDSNVNLISPVTSPTSYIGARSLSAIFCNVSICFSAI